MAVSRHMAQGDTFLASRVLLALERLQSAKALEWDEIRQVMAYPSASDRSTTLLCECVRLVHSPAYTLYQLVRQHMGQSLRSLVGGGFIHTTITTITTITTHMILWFVLLWCG